MQAAVTQLIPQIKKLGAALFCSEFLIWGSFLDRRIKHL